MGYYIDTSALAKLVVAEPESEALRRWIGDHGAELLGSDLTRAELLRATRRVAPDLVVEARTVLESITLTELTTEIFDEAGRLDPPGLRTLDALHIVAALDLGDDVEGMVTYDERLAAAAEANGIAVAAPA